MDANPTAKDKTIALFLQTDLTDQGKAKTSNEAATEYYFNQMMAEAQKAVAGQ